MRLRLAFKLHGEEADLARQIADAAGVEVDKIAKLAMQRYMREVIEKATEMAKMAQQGESNGTPIGNQVHVDGVVPPVQDSLSSPAP